MNVLSMGASRWRHHGDIVLRICVWALLALLLTSCTTATLNVRARRAYSNEEPLFEVTSSRADDLVAVSELLDQLLLHTPYTPGADWVRSLALTDERAEGYRDQILRQLPYKLDEHEIPIIKLYRMHLEQVLGKARANGRGEHEYGSVFEAFDDLLPRDQSFALWLRGLQRAQTAQITAEIDYQRELRTQPVVRSAIASGGSVGQGPAARERLDSAHRERLAHRLGADVAMANVLELSQSLKSSDVTTDRQRQLARDGLAIVSMAYRLDLESLALLPTATSHATETLRDHDGRRSLRAGSRQVELASLPTLLSALQRRYERELAITEALTDALSRLTQTDVDDTAGFEFRESIVDQVVGVAWDSFRLHLKANFEVLFFHQSGGQDPATQTSDVDEDDSIIDDFTGRTRRLRYQVDPVFLIGARAQLAFDWIKLPNAFTLNGGFVTDRLFSSGGSIETSTSLGTQLGLEGLWSDVFDIGLGLLGVKTMVKKATFNSGEVEEVAVDPATGRDLDVVGRAPLQLQTLMVDVGYDVSFLAPELFDRYWVEELQLGFRYFNYRLPRILYELQDTDPDPERSYNTFVRESPPQVLDSVYYMGGMVGRLGRGDRGLLSPYVDLGLYVGSGPMEYYFLRDGGEGDGLAIREDYEASVFVVNFSTGLGMRLRITPARSRFRFFVDGHYHLDLIKQTITTAVADTATVDGQTVEISAGRKVDFGTTDIMHGPQLYLIGTL